MPKETPDSIDRNEVLPPMLMEGSVLEWAEALKATFESDDGVDSGPLKEFLKGEAKTLAEFLDGASVEGIPTEDDPSLSLNKRAERAMYKVSFLALGPAVYKSGDVEKSLEIAKEVKELAYKLHVAVKKKQREAKRMRIDLIDALAVFERPGDTHTSRALVLADEYENKFRVDFTGLEEELIHALKIDLKKKIETAELTFAKSNDGVAKVGLVTPFVEDIISFLIDKRDNESAEKDEVIKPDLSKMTMPPVLLSQAITVDPADRREDAESIVPTPSAYINTVVPETSFSVSDQATESVVLVQPERKGYGKRIAMALTGIFAIGGVAATSAVVIYQQENNIAEDIGSSADLKDAAPSGVVAEPRQKEEIAEAVEEPEVIQEIPEPTNWPELYSEYLYMYYNRGNAEVPHADVCELITMVRTDGYTKRKLTVKTPKSMGDIKEFNGQKRLPNNELHGPIQVGAERKHKVDVFLPVYSPKVTSITVEWDLDGEVSRRTYQLGDSPFYGLEAFTLIDGSNIKEEGSKLTLKVYMKGEEKPLNEKVFEVQLLAEDELVTPQKVQKKTVRAVNSIVEPMPEAISEEPELEPASVPEPAPIVEEPTNKKGRKNKKRKRN